MTFRPKIAFFNLLTLLLLITTTVLSETASNSSTIRNQGLNTLRIQDVNDIKNSVWNVNSTTQYHQRRRGQLITVENPWCKTFAKKCQKESIQVVKNCTSLTTKYKKQFQTLLKKQSVFTQYQIGSAEQTVVNVTVVMKSQWNQTLTLLNQTIYDNYNQSLQVFNQSSCQNNLLKCRLRLRSLKICTIVVTYFDIKMKNIFNRNQPTTTSPRSPTESPRTPTHNPIDPPTVSPRKPTQNPIYPTSKPSYSPSKQPTISPRYPTRNPIIPTSKPIHSPTTSPITKPPTVSPRSPTNNPLIPTSKPIHSPTTSPTTELPTVSPRSPTMNPVIPTSYPSKLLLTRSPSSNVPPPLSPISIQVQPLPVLSTTNMPMSNSPLTLRTLPTDLYLRGKKGIGLSIRPFNNTLCNYERISMVKSLNVYWNYGWNYDRSICQPSTIDFLSMAWNGGKNISDFRNRIRNAYLPDYVANGTIKLIMGYNEPDRVGQADMTVNDAIERWSVLQELGIPIVSPSAGNPEGVWMKEFIGNATIHNLRVDYIGVHSYAGTDAQLFIKKMVRIYELYKKPIIITEFGSADWSATSKSENKILPCNVLLFMKQVLPWLEETKWIHGYAWFPFSMQSIAGWPSALFSDDENNTLTLLGQYYQSVTNENPKGDETITCS